MQYTDNLLSKCFSEYSQDVYLQIVATIVWMVAGVRGGGRGLLHTLSKQDLIKDVSSRWLLIMIEEHLKNL